LIGPFHFNRVNSRIDGKSKKEEEGSGDGTGCPPVILDRETQKSLKKED